MEEFRKKQLDLLSELDAVCRQEGIHYILTHFTAQSACLKHDLPSAVAVPTVGMRYSDAMKLIKAIGPRDDRSFESGLDNRRIARPIIRYCDTGSTLVNYSDCSDFDVKGVGIDIELIRDVPRSSLLARLFALLEIMCLLNVHLRSSSPFWRILLYPMILLERPFLRAIYRRGSGKRCRITRFPKQSVKFPAELLDRTVDVELGGRSFRIPEKLERYLEIEAGPNWRSGKIKSSLEDIHTCVIDPAVCYKDYSDILASGKRRPGMSIVSWYLLRARIKRLRKKIHAYWDILFFAGDRFSLWKQYSPRKDELCRLAADGKSEELRSAMQPYIDSIYKNLRTGMTLCFDPELFEIAAGLIESEKGHDYVEMLRSKIRPEHLEAIHIKGFGK